MLHRGYAQDLFVKLCYTVFMSKRTNKPRKASRSKKTAKRLAAKHVKLLKSKGKRNSKNI